MATVKKKTGPKPVAQQKLDAIGIDAIVEMIVDGQSYRQIAGKAGVSLSLLAGWMDANPERSRACARARELSAQAFDEQALRVVETAKDVFALAKAKEMAVHLRWRAKAANPRRYGDKVALGGSDDLPPMQTRTAVSLSNEELLAIAARAKSAE